MKNSEGSDEQIDFGLTDGTLPPFSNDHDKLHSILNVLRGHEEFTLSIDGIIISSNLEAVNITGYEEWEVIGKPFAIFYLEEDVLLDQQKKDLQVSLTEGKFVNNSWKLKKRNIKFWARIKILPIIDSLQSLRGYKVIVRDATHKVFSDFNVQKVRKEYLKIYHNSTFGILRFNRLDGNITVANTKAMEILGITSFNQFLFKDAFLKEDDFIRFNELVQNQRYVNSFEFQLKHVKEGRKWASIDCKFYLSSGLIEGIIIDITERKSQEFELQKLSNDLNTFIYHASHDLRSPLTTILGLLNLLEMDENGTGVNDYSGMIRDRIVHLDSLLKDLTVVAFNSYSEIVHERVFVQEELEFMIRDFLNNHKVKPHLHVTTEINFVSDLLRFRTIVKNLISNSIQYHNQMEKNPFVKITAISDKDKLILEVEDNGIGIDVPEMDKIYNMFHRGHSSRSGFGLGLYTARSMVDKLGGTIRISSVIGVGTKVWIELPNRIL